MKKIIKHSSIVLLSIIFSSSVFACHDQHRPNGVGHQGDCDFNDNADIAGEIDQFVALSMNSQAIISMQNGVVTSQDLAIAANVPFTISMNSANDLKMVNNTHTVVYTFNIKNTNNDIVLSSQATSASHSEISEVWTLNITPEGIDGSTKAGHYIDTITISVDAAT